MDVSNLIIDEIRRNHILKKCYSNYERIFPTYLFYVKRELAGCTSFLDLGCGPNSPLSCLSDCAYSVGVEFFMPYLSQSKEKGLHSDYVRADIRNIEFKPKSFDCVISLDVLEHLSKSDGYKLIEKMEQIASKKIILFTVNSFVPQKMYDENPLQLHKSGWTEEEFTEMGYEVNGINGLKFLRGELSNSKFRVKIFGDLVSDYTQKMTYYYAKYAFQLLCVKQIGCHK